MSDNNYSRVEDLSDRENVDVIEDNRMVVNTSSESDDDRLYTMNVSIEKENKTVTKTFRAESEQSLVLQFIKWYEKKSNDDIAKYL